ncbi:MAG: nuclear transport factor 2 family protein [Candidatus Acidiferrum sp.]|jgi:ketosteroid isomerase-like protein
MFRIVALLALGLMLPWCICAQDPDETPVNPELQRQEIVNIENETARAILLNNGTFFRRVYSDDFAGTLSHGQAVDRNHLIQVVESGDLKFQVFLASDVKVRLYRDAAVATCLWTFRGDYRGQHFNGQMRVTHVFVNTPRGWHVIAEQNTALPPDGGPPL